MFEIFEIMMEMNDHFFFLTKSKQPLFCFGRLTVKWLPRGYGTSPTLTLALFLARNL
jgi:hypothetical protein